MTHSINPKATTKIVVKANKPTKEIKQNPKIYYINPKEDRKNRKEKQRTDETNRKHTAG